MYKIIIASSIYRDNLVAELWYNNELLLEINQEETTALSVQLYRLQSESVTLNLEEFLSKVMEARAKLIEK